jgi:hypothetical protein
VSRGEEAGVETDEKQGQKVMTKIKLLADIGMSKCVFLFCFVSDACQYFSLALSFAAAWGTSALPMS